MSQTQPGEAGAGEKICGRFFPARGEIAEALPGLLAVVLPITVAAEILWYIEIRARATFFVDIFIAALLALLVANFIRIPDRFKAGPALAQKWFLRLGIIIYGLKFSYGYLVETGWQYLIVVLAAVVSAICVSLVMGRLSGLDEKTSALIGNGTAVCGIAALMATAPAIGAKEENSSIAIGVILFWGTLALFVYPLIAAATNMSAAVYGAWCGAAIHDLPQIIAAAKQGRGNDALQAALMVKMIRIAFIVVVVLGMNIFFTYREHKAAGTNQGGTFMAALKSLPGFVIVFFFVVLINTLVKIPDSIAGPLATYPATKTPFTAASLLLTMAIIGICCKCTVATIKSAGMKALATGGIAFFIQSGLVLWFSSVFFGN